MKNNHDASRYITRRVIPFTYDCMPQSQRICLQRASRIGATLCCDVIDANHPL